jgi:hypothetical protein
VRERSLGGEAGAAVERFERRVAADRNFKKIVVTQEDGVYKLDEN